MSKNYSQIIRAIDKNCKSNSVSYPLLDKNEDINDASAHVWGIIFKSSGKWQFDDGNHEDYPFITSDLNENQRDYPFTTDEAGNLILDVYKVMVKNPAGIYQEIYPIDQQSDEFTQGFWSGLNQKGTPSRYDKTANAIMLDALPAYSSEDGVKMFINREGVYFDVDATTEMPGFCGLYHEYLALRPSYYYAMREGLDNKNDLFNQMTRMEQDIAQYYRDRSKDEIPVIVPETVCSI